MMVYDCIYGVQTFSFIMTDGTKREGRGYGLSESTRLRLSGLFPCLRAAAVLPSDLLIYATTYNAVQPAALKLTPVSDHCVSHLTFRYTIYRTATHKQPADQHFKINSSPVYRYRDVK